MQIHQLLIFYHISSIIAALSLYINWCFYIMYMFNFFSWTIQELHPLTLKNASLDKVHSPVQQYYKIKFGNYNMDTMPLSILLILFKFHQLSQKCDLCCEFFSGPWSNPESLIAFSLHASLDSKLQTSFLKTVHKLSLIIFWCYGSGLK